MKTVNDVAMELLEKHCAGNLRCYAKDKHDYAHTDMHEVYPDGVDGFTADEIADELQRIGDAQPPEMKNPEWHMVYDGGFFVDGYDCESEGHAINAALDTLIMWMTDMCARYKIASVEEMHNNAEFLEDWNMMIEECCCYIQHRDPIPVPVDTPCYDMGWENIYLTDEQLESIGWKTIEEE